MKLVINDCYGGFSLSRKAVERLREMGNGHALEEDIKDYWEMTDGRRVQRPDIYLFDIPRDDPQLIQIIEEMGDEANGEAAKLKIIEIPDDVEWIVQEYDGIEWVAEKHRTWS